MKNIALLCLLIIPAIAQQPKFDAADVHVSPTASSFAQNFGGVLREGRYVNRDATMLKLIASAYGVSEDAVGGGPGWLSSDLFDVIAKVPDGTSLATANLMLRTLLAERFNLVIKSGTRPVPRYVMSVAKGGSKLKAAGGTDKGGCQQKQQPGGPPGDLASVPNIKVSCSNLTAAGIAENLRQMANGYFDRDIVDSTKLEGSYDFDLEWTARGALAAKGSDGISAFDAVEKQLGLKVELKDVELPGMVVASVNRKPTPNPDGIQTTLSLAAARFEAAAIKPANPDDPRPLNGLLYTGGSQMRSGGTLPFLIALALQISPNVANDMVVGVPKSLESQRWDITAKVPNTGEGAPNIVNGRPQPPPLSVGLEMLRGLLVDQFALKTHTENREVTVYALTLNSGKPKMTKADDSERSGCKPDPNAPKPATNIQVMISCKNTSMAELAQFLQQQASAYMDHPVADATGLPGGWNFMIGWTPKALLQPQASNPNQPGGAAEPSEPNGISAFEAVEKELGLKLVRQKRSIPVIVVDHVNEKPDN
ncbi:MAG TPA: TIGR03435 family protein [Bryobacteraceae bacterium]|nr:TIGR03435 family protein [Bryobacteraceae bacterium]